MHEATHSSFQARQQHQRLIQKREALHDALYITSRALERHENDKTCMTESVARAYRDEHEQATMQLREVESALADSHEPEAQMASLYQEMHNRVEETTSAQTWPDPEPLIRELSESDPYPIDALDDVLRDAATILSTTIQSPVALCGQSVLAAATLAVQAHADVVIDGRRVPCSEYFLSVARTGERKSAVDKAALAPHARRQRALYQDMLERQIEYEAESLAWRKAREETLTKAKSYAEKKAALLALGPEPLRPLDVMLTTEEPTYEGLVKALAHGWPSIGLFSDEAGRFLGGYGMDSQNQLKTIAGLSKLWDGSPITRTRSGDGNLLLYGRRLAVHLMMQPGVSDCIFGNTLLSAQGFLSRCLVTYPASCIGSQSYKEVDVQQQPGMQRYARRLGDILEAALPLAENTRNELAPREILLAPDAKRIWILFHDHIQSLMRADQPLASIQGLAAKAAEHAARLAGVLTLTGDFQAKQIDRQAIESGISLTEFYLSEALRLFHAATVNPDLLLAEKLLRWMQTRGEQIYLQAIYQYGPNAIRDKATARRIVGILENHNWIRPIEGGAVIDGAFRRQAWEVHP